MASAVALIEVLALLGLVPGFVCALTTTVLRRPLDNIQRATQRLPPERFRTAVVLPMASIFAGSISGVGANLLTNEPDRILYVYVFVTALFVACVVVVIFGHLEFKLTRPVGGTAIAYRRELLAELHRRDWAAATRYDRATATRRAARLAATGTRLIAYAESQSIRQWILKRHPLQLAWFAAATAATTIALLYVLGARMMAKNWTVEPGLLLFVVSPPLGPAQLWLRHRRHQATLRAIGAELHAEASSVLTAIAAASPPPLRLRIMWALSTLLDLRTPPPRRIRHVKRLSAD
ncbi:hypothetical protein ACH4OY_31090 [Micromonospora rubida]|uniref:Uncharacterized protein n=1 Tax=Micromonospora rubida TaxID=2697657 RepID=A0ABW7STT7_9ACTN